MDRYALKPVLVTAAGAAVMTAETLRDHLNLTSDSKDDLLTAYIAAATQYLDGYSGVLGRCLINQTWKVMLGEWGDDIIRLPLAPVSSITHVKYYDSSNTLQTLASGEYRLHEDAFSPYIAWTSTATFPAVYDRHDAIEVTFVAGYGAAGTNIPTGLLQAIKMLCGHWFANREAVIETRKRGDSFTEIPFAVSALLAPYDRNKI